MNRKSLLLCVLLILALALTACGGQDDGEPALAEATVAPTSPPVATEAPTATAVPSPTATVAPSPTPGIPLGDVYRSEEGGYAFATVPEYEVEDFYGFISMMGPDADPNFGPAIMLVSSFEEEATTLENSFDELLQEIVGGENVEIELANQQDTTVSGVPGMAVDLLGNFEGKNFTGRIVVALVTPTHPFAMFGIAPAEGWAEFVPLFDAVLASVSFFEPESETASTTAEPAGAEIRQWASSAIASSEYGNPDWAASQATGAPDTLVDECADLPTAWASYENDTAEWIELTYDIPVIPTQINIIQTHSPDQVVKVEVIDLTGAYHEIYTGEPENLWDECPYTLSIPVDVDYEVAALKISIDQSIVPTTWNEIDAVELVGIAAGETAGTSADDELQVEALRGFKDKYGTLFVVGLLTNHSQQAVEAVELEIVIRDASGLPLHKDVIWTSLYRIAPGETTPFRLVVHEDLTGIDSFTATVANHSATELSRSPVGVRGVVRSIDDDGNVHLTGEITNNGSQPVAIKGVAAATFDGAGEIVTADAAMVTTGYLEPGASGPFRVFMYGPVQGLEAIVDHVIYVDALPTSPEEPWPIAFSEETRVYVDRYDDVHLVGEVTNVGDETLDILLLAAFYDADGNVLDADKLTMPADLAPGETLPFDMVGGWAVLEHTSGLFDQVDHYTITGDQYWTWKSSEVTVDLATDNDTQEFNKDNASFTGQIVNDSGTAVDKAFVIVGLRDAATGKLVATGYDAVFDEIPPDGSADYIVSIDLEPGEDATSLEIFFIVKGEQS